MLAPLVRLRNFFFFFFFFFLVSVGLAVCHCNLLASLALETPQIPPKTEDAPATALAVLKTVNDHEVVLVSGNAEGQIVIYTVAGDARNGVREAVVVDTVAYKAHKSPITALAFHPLGNVLASAAADDHTGVLKVGLWTAGSRAPL